MKTWPACNLAVVMAMLVAWAPGQGAARAATQSGDAAPAAGPGGSPPTVLITGASRGIGLEFARQLAGRGWQVIATARDPAGSAELVALADADPDVTLEPLDVTDHAAVDQLAAKYRGRGIDLLLLNAALGPNPATAMAPLAKLDFDNARLSFETNALGPVKLCQAFMDHVAASGRKQIVAISSDSGSFVAGAQKPILYNYKASKAALNMYLHTLAFETPRRSVTLVMLHPGLVGTNPGLMRFPGALKTGDSVGQMLGVIEKLTPADNGRFIDYRGETMPW
jgi:NAD(P)-dependent dehydrogenase (short-subunit alcohol dehydrogenase family)